MTRIRKTVFLLGVPRSLKHVLSKLPWVGSVVIFESYGALLAALREAQTIENERATASATAPRESATVDAAAAAGALSSSALDIM